MNYLLLFFLIYFSFQVTLLYLPLLKHILAITSASLITWPSFYSIKLFWHLLLCLLFLPIKFKADTNNFDQSLPSNQLFIESSWKWPILNPPSYESKWSIKQWLSEKNILSPPHTTSHLLLLTPTNHTVNHPLVSFPPIMTIHNISF